MTITVYRRGAGSDEMTMYLRAADSADLTVHAGRVAVAFRTGGQLRGTDWSVQIDYSSYDELVSLMIALAPAKAVKAFGKLTMRCVDYFDDVMRDTGGSCYQAVQ